MAVRAPRRKTRRRVLPPVHVNPGIAAVYRRRLEAAIDAMNRSLAYWLAAAWRKDPPKMALDARPPTPADRLRQTMAALGRRWQSRFDKLAEELAEHFTTRVEDRTSGRLEQILREAGVAVEFKVTPTVRDQMQASIAENVGLIKSIAREHLQKVEGAVMRSVQVGYDVGTMTRDVQAIGEVTRKRAAFIARDQTSKMTAVITRARQEELKIEKAMWMHSGGGREPRPSHRANDGQIYDVRTGWFDPDERRWVWPGTLINCRCVSKPIIEGF